MSKTGNNGKVDNLIAQIKTERIGQTGKNVLVVEGSDDVLAFGAFMRKKKASWEQSWHIAPANGKSRVLDVLGKEPDWFGVVDCDEWTDAQVGQATQQHRHLFVLPRFCIESYLIVPAEIWEALPQKQRNKLPNGFIDLDEAIQANFDKWVRHAALWQVIHPLYQQMRNSDYRGNILDNPLNVPDHSMLANILKDWLTGFNPTAIASEVVQAERALRDLPMNTVFTRHLYAKKFYPMVVHDALNRLLGQKEQKQRVEALLRFLPLPTDLDPLWARMGL